MVNLQMLFQVWTFYIFSVCKLKRLSFGPAEMFRNHFSFNIVLRLLYHSLNGYPQIQLN